MGESTGEGAGIRASESARGLERRALLKAGLGGAALIGVAGGARAGAGASLAPVRFSPRSARRFDPLLWLVDHATQGYTAAEYDLAQSLGYDGYLEYHLDHEAIDDTAIEAQLAADYPSLSMTGIELHDNYAAFGSGDIVARELKQATILRSIRSPRQLFERVVQFWSEHFSMDHNDIWVRWLRTLDDRDTIRRNALGDFRTLLRNSAHSSAMLFYLDNHISSDLAPNENYARELMELHTLGVDGGYSETDIQEVARALTGWRFHLPGTPQTGVFLYDDAVHDQGAKTILGNVLPPNQSLLDGEQVIDILVQHPACPQFLARKLTRWLLAYDAPQQVVDRVAQAYVDTSGDIKAMVRETLSYESMLATQAWSRPKFRRPYHLAISLVRATGATVSEPAALISETAAMGHSPFDWPTPDGYPDSLESWGTGLLPRWSFASRFFDDQILGISVDVVSLFSPIGGFHPAQGAAQIDQVLTGGNLSVADVAEVQAFLDAQASVGEVEIREALALAASSPSYQAY